MSLFFAKTGFYLRVFRQGDRRPFAADAKDSDNDRGSIVSASPWRDEQMQIVAANAAGVIPDRYQLPFNIQPQING